MLPQAARNHYRRQQRLITATLLLVRNEWSRMGDDLDASWAQIASRVALLTASAQVGSASNGAAYVPASLAEIGQGVDVDVRVNPRALVGAQSLDGLTYGSLEALLYGAVVHARSARVDTLQERLQVGGKMLDLLVHTQVSDAAKQSASVAMVARDVGYVRAVNPPCCKDCANLAGKFFRSNSGFQRHPGCDCFHIPTTVAQPGGFGQTVDPSQITGLTKAERQALDDGADLSRVVNANRGRSAGHMTTSELKPRRGQRLTPEGIYRVSATREEALGRLRENGYLL